MATRLQDFISRRVPFKDIPQDVIDDATESGELFNYVLNDVDGDPNQGQLESFGAPNETKTPDEPVVATETDTELDNFESKDAGFADDAFFDETPDPAFDTDTELDDFDVEDAGFTDDAFFADELDNFGNEDFGIEVDDFDAADAGFSNDSFFNDELDNFGNEDFGTEVDDFDAADAGFANDSFFADDDDFLADDAEEVAFFQDDSLATNDFDDFGNEDFSINEEESGGGTPIQIGGEGGEFAGTPTTKTASGQEADLDPNDDPLGDSDSGAVELSEKPASATAKDKNAITKSQKTASAQSAKKKASGLEADLTVEINPRQNELDNFGSYTYNIALYMLTPKEYVRMLKAPKTVAQAPKFLLMRNGGVGNDPELASEFSNTEFFIDDVTFDNIGPNPSTRTGNTNAINIKFMISEPNGCTLLERLKKQSEQSLEEDQSYTNTPYLMEIKFKGYDEFGKPSQNIAKPKYVPIKITSIKFSVDTTGTQYRITAIPYHHDVFSSLRSTIPVNVQVSAGSVGDVLKGAAQAVTTETIRIDDDEAANGLGFYEETRDVLGEKAISLPEAINNHFKAQTQRKTIKDPKTKKDRVVEPSSNLAEVWKFDIADSILDAKLVGERIDALNTTQKTKNVYQQYGSVMKGKINLVKDKKLFKINAGTSVINLINYIIVASSYVKENIISDLQKSAADKEQLDKPIKWFKVVPQITDCLGWDKKQGRYKFEITWTVQTNGVFYNDYPWAPKSKPKGEGVHKIYDYIFTGQNKHVLDLKLDFNMAYYQAVTLGTGNPENDKTPNTISPQTKDTPQSNQGQTVADDETVEDKRAKDLMGTILNDGTDLIQCDFSIIGDLAFLPTGDGFFQPQGNQGKVYSVPFMPDGTINYDLTPPYVQLNFKTPTDYDDLTGFADPNVNKKYGTAEFSGVYQIIKVSNTFSGGIFRQQLRGVRAKMQPVNGKIARSKEALKNSERRQKAQDDQKQFLLSLLGGRNNLPLSGLAAKLSSAAQSSITSIATNTVPKIGAELDQVAPQVIQDEGTGIPFDIQEIQQTPLQEFPVVPAVDVVAADTPQQRTFTQNIEIRTGGGSTTRLADGTVIRTEADGTTTRIA